MTPEVPPAATVVPDPDAHVVTPVAPVVTTVRRRRVLSRDVDGTYPAADGSPWLWLLGLLVLLLVGFLIYFATRGNDQPVSTTPSPATTVVVQQPPVAPPPAAPPVIVQQPPVIVQQAPAQQQPTQAASQPAPSAT